MKFKVACRSFTVWQTIQTQPYGQLRPYAFTQKRYCQTLAQAQIGIEYENQLQNETKIRNLSILTVTVFRILKVEEESLRSGPRYNKFESRACRRTILFSILRPTQYLLDRLYNLNANPNTQVYPCLWKQARLFEQYLTVLARYLLRFLLPHEQKLIFPIRRSI